MAAAAVMMVIPAYTFKDEEMHKVVIFSELFAVAAMIICMLFIVAELGRPDRFWHLIPFIGALAFSAYAVGGCTTAKCHEGIADIRSSDSEMMQTIKANGSQHGDPDGCVMCHGGNPKAVEKEKAHQGIPPTLRIAPGPKDYYPDPGSIWIAEHSCEACHVGYGYRAELSLMNTEAGKIQGNLHTWGFEEVANYKVPWGNYDAEDLDGQEPIFGRDQYKAYMVQQIKLYPEQYPTSLKKIPSATMDEINQNPKKAGLTYQRHDCQRCHIGVRGREKRGDYRGLGCSACHVLYSNDGFNDGTQLAAVGTYWPIGRAFNKEELDTLLLAGTCMVCHQNMTDKKLWEKVSEKGKLNTMEHIELMNKMIKYMAEKAQKGKDW